MWISGTGEKIIRREDRNLDYLKETVQKIVNAIYNTWRQLKDEFPVLTTEIGRDIKFITTQELEDMYPDLTPSERKRHR